MKKIVVCITLMLDYLIYFLKSRINAILKLSNKVEVMPHKEYLQIAVKPTGGLGDYIVSSKFMDELFTYAPCKIDVYCEKMEFGEAIFAKRPFMRVLPISMYDNSAYQYDLAMEVEHFIHVQHYNAKRVYVFSPHLFRIVEKIRLKWNEIYLMIPQQCYRERIHFQQMEMQGLNRYSELRMQGCFRISDRWSGIFMDQEAYEAYVSLGLKKKEYITCNYGADRMGKKKHQIKMWPKEYFETLFEMIHKEYPNIRIIQIGDAKCDALFGADAHILGENLEVTKWILKQSLLHIDCEGGLVHMATQLGTPCEVIFGPTPLTIYSYPQNRNLVNPSCNGCMGIHENWAFQCYKNEEQPACIYGVTPLIVWKDIKQYMETKEVLQDKKYVIKENCEKESYKNEFCEDELNHYQSLCFRDNQKLLTWDEGWTMFYRNAISAVKERRACKIALINPKRDWLPFILAKMGLEVFTFDADYGCGNDVVLFGSLMQYGIESGVDMRLASDFSIPYGNESVDFVIIFSMGNKHIEYLVREANRILCKEGYYLTNDMYLN
ncbi:glycosyltransferase family 9 protein [Parablautia muri]|uniref:Glycosyltransferase n=1 Tax=Parablautia muri TaxID=2320879 RepID=A0A9X5BDY5_9FIRM|nr:hypothetical protein [Parablautia muri]NBJ92055.1 hypothetical protein [Parablautia muri]